MKINWTVRIKNKVFWMSIIPALLILVQTIANVFGFVIDLGELSGKLLAVVEAVFIVLAILGIVADPTTEGMTDSEQALTYTKPKR